MSDEQVFIVSDLHLGSEFFHRDLFLKWFHGLPPGTRLILNGDIVDEPEEPLPEADARVLRELVDAAAERPVVWICGNHDTGTRHPGNGGMEFVESWCQEGRLVVMHGDFLDDVMPRHGAFKWFFRRLHRVRMALGAPRVHVAQYAKRWRWLYEVLNRHVASNAVRRARQLGCPVIVCGHTHQACDEVIDEIRYVNTGAWTERPLCYVAVDAAGIRLEEFAGAPG